MRTLASLVIAAMLTALFVHLGSSLWRQLDVVSHDATLPTESYYAPFLDDYVVYYTAGHMVLHSEAANLYDLETVRYDQSVAAGQTGEDVMILPFFNPPFVAGLMAPLALLPLQASAVLFTVLSVAGLAVALRLLLGGMPRLQAALWALGAFASMPFYYTVLHGQFSFLLLLIFTAAYVLLKRRRDAAAGAVLALLLMKPQLLPLPLLLLLVDRRHAALKGFAAAGVALAVASLLIGGVAPADDYVRLLAKATTWHDSNGILVLAMFGWNAFFTGLIGGTAFGLISLLAGLASVATIVICVLAWRGTRDAQAESAFDLRYSVLILGTLLICPHLYGQDLIIAVIPLVLLYRAAAQPLMKLAMAGVALTGWYTLHEHFRLLYLTGINFVTLFMFAVMLGAALALLRPAWLRSRIESWSRNAATARLWLGARRTREPQPVFGATAQRSARRVAVPVASRSTGTSSQGAEAE